MPHCLGQSGHTVSITTHDIYTQINTFTVCPLGEGKKKKNSPTNSWSITVNNVHVNNFHVTWISDSNQSLCWTVLGQDTESKQTLGWLFRRGEKNSPQLICSKISSRMHMAQKKNYCSDTQQWIEIPRTVSFSHWSQIKWIKQICLPGLYRL